MKIKKVAFDDNATRQVNTADFTTVYLYTKSYILIYIEIDTHTRCFVGILFKCIAPLFLLSRAVHCAKIMQWSIMHLCDFTIATEKNK